MEGAGCVVEAVAHGRWLLRRDDRHVGTVVADESAPSADLISEVGFVGRLTRGEQFVDGRRIMRITGAAATFAERVRACAFRSS